jgi:DNA-binding transcriptional ArsR family regulator
MAGTVDWKVVARATLHPLQVEILEAAASRDRLSPAQFESNGASVSLVSYHFRYLRTRGLLQAAGTAPKRGATEHFYRLSDPARS